MSTSDGPAQHAAPKHPICKCCRLVAAIIVVCGMVMVAAAWGLGKWLEAPAGAPTKSDVIVVLGGDTGSRLLATVDLYKKGIAPAIFLAGVESDELSTYEPDLNIRLQYL